MIQFTCSNPSVDKAAINSFYFYTASSHDICPGSNFQKEIPNKALFISQNSDIILQSLHLKKENEGPVTII